MNHPKRRTRLKSALSAVLGLLAAPLVLVATAAPAPAFAQLPFFPPAACGLTPTNGTESKTMVYGFDYPRQYNIHVPAGLSGKVPLLISLHDQQSSNTAQETNSGWTAYSDSKKFIVAYPEGNNGTFNPMGAAPDKDFLRALVGEISKNYCVDATRVYIDSSFEGALMAEKMACVAADVYAAAAFVSTTMNPDPSLNCSPSRPIAIGVFQLENSSLVTVANGAAVRDSWIGRDQCSTAGTPDPNPYGAEGAVYGGCGGGANVLWRTYTGAGGGLQNNYPTGAALNDLHDKAWGFFMAHPRP